MRKVLLWLLAAVVLAGCGADDTISRKYPCRFLFYTSWHPTSLIVTSLANYNQFVKISVVSRSGAYVVNASDQQGNSESVNLTNEYENRFYSSGIYLGAGGASGAIIAGMTNFNGYVAWDSQCPNCATEYTTRYALSWTSVQTQVKCNNCSRTYSLETGNILSGAAGERLMQYAVTYTGTGSTLQIGN